MGVLVGYFRSPVNGYALAITPPPLLPTGGYYFTRRHALGLYVGMSVCLASNLLNNFIHQSRHLVETVSRKTTTNKLK